MFIVMIVIVVKIHVTAFFIRRGLPDYGGDDPPKHGDEEEGDPGGMPYTVHQAYEEISGDYQQLPGEAGEPSYTDLTVD